jgi:hypothetical protein
MARPVLALVTLLAVAAAGRAEEAPTLSVTLSTDKEPSRSIDQLVRLQVVDLRGR